MVTMEGSVAKRRSSETDANLLTTTAENLGAALGHVAARLEGWKKQRAEIAKDLQRTIQTAQNMLTDLGHDTVAAGRRGLARSRRKGGRPKGYVMSDETKAKLRAAWRRRKAAAEAKRKS
jgi:hypothetical protein